jgi:hypothetical protein
MIDIVEVKPLGDKKLLVKFENYKEQCVVDMNDFLKSWNDFYLVKELEDENKFQDFKLDHGAIVWANGFDIAPEYLFFLAHQHDTQYISLFRQWGYIK